MRPSYHLCLGCLEKPITWQFAICSSCESIYGNRATEWPVWLRESWNMEQRERRREKKARHYETHFTDLETEIDE